MTDAIDDLERLHAAATQGERRVRVDAPNYIATGHGNEFANAAKAYDPNDAAFIVAAHNHLPALLATLREMREALERIDDDAQFDTGLELRAIARAALERARERLGAK